MRNAVIVEENPHGRRSRRHLRTRVNAGPGRDYSFIGL